MHVALLANTAWLDEELPSFQQLVVGLLGEQVRVAQVLPETVSLDESSVFGERVLWQESRWALLNRYRLGGLARHLRSVGVDVIHALDGRLWDGATLLAQRMQVPVVFTANSSLDVALADQVATALPSDQYRVTATTEPIAEGLRRALPVEVEVSVIRPGTHMGEAVRPRAPEQATCIVVSGDGRLDDRYQRLMEGMQSLIERHPMTQVFFDGQGSDQHAVWRQASQLHLLSNMSMIPRRLGHRELLVRADVIVQPQALGRSRGLLLQAMAHAMPLIVQADAWVDDLIHDVNAWVVDAPEAVDWTGQLRRLIEQPDEAFQLGRRAQQWVHEHRLAARQIEETLRVYEGVTGQVVPFV